MGAIDQLYKPPRTYYIQVHNWNDRRKGLPVISWTMRPADLSRSMRRKATNALLDFTSRLRAPDPMEVKLDVKKHAELHARMVLGAS